MGNIETTFKKLRENKKKALIPFFTACYPSKEMFKELLMISERAGVDIIEIGIPFSDPLCDGASIQYSSQWALNRGVNLFEVLDEIENLSYSINVPLIIMTYINPVLHFGIKKFLERLKSAGFSGLIIPDLIIEEGDKIESLCKYSNVDLIYLVAPTSGKRRLKKITSRSKRFVYVVSLTGVTGEREELSSDLPEFLVSLREVTEKPLCLGFGISKKVHVINIKNFVDGIIVGSAIVNFIRGKENEISILSSVEEFLLNLRGMHWMEM